MSAKTVERIGELLAGTKGVVSQADTLASGLKGLTTFFDAATVKALQDGFEAAVKSGNAARLRTWHTDLIDEINKIPDAAKKSSALDMFDTTRNVAMKNALEMTGKTLALNTHIDTALLSGKQITKTDLETIVARNFSGVPAADLAPTLTRAQRRIDVFEGHATQIALERTLTAAPANAGKSAAEIAKLAKDETDRVAKELYDAAHRAAGASGTIETRKITDFVNEARAKLVKDMTGSDAALTQARTDLAGEMSAKRAAPPARDASLAPRASDTAPARLADSPADRADLAAKGKPEWDAAVAKAAPNTSPFKDANFSTPTQRAESTSTKEFKKGIAINSKVDDSYKPPAKVFLYDETPQSKFREFFWPKNQAPLRILTHHWHRSSNWLYQYAQKARNIGPGKIEPAEMSKYIPRMFIPERFLRPTIREMDKAINAAGLVPETVKLEKALMRASEALSGSGSIADKRSAAQKIIEDSFQEFASRNKVGLAKLKEAAEVRLAELEAFRNAKDKDGKEIRLELPDVGSKEKRLKKLPGEEMIAERQYQATKKYLEDMRDMADALAHGKGANNDLMAQFIKKASESDNGSALTVGILNKIGRLGSDVRIRLANHYQGEGAPLLDRDGNFVDKALSHADIPGRLVYKLESELEAGLYIRSIRWEKSPPASNVENRFSQFVHYNDSDLVKKTANGSPIFVPTDENTLKAMVEEYFDSDLPAHAIHGIYMLHMTQGIGRSSPIPTSLKSHMINMAAANKGTARGEWAEAMASRIDEVLEQAYKFGERDITKNHFQLQLWEYFKRCGYISAPSDEKWSIWGIPMGNIMPLPGAPGKIVVANKKAEVWKDVTAYLSGKEVWIKKDLNGDSLDQIETFSNPWFKSRAPSTTPEGKQYLEKKGLVDGTHVEDDRTSRAPRALKIIDNWTGGAARDLLMTGGLYSRTTGFNHNLFWKYYANVGVYGGGITAAWAGTNYLMGDKEAAKENLATFGNVLTAPIRYGWQGATLLSTAGIAGLGYLADGTTRAVSYGAQVVGLQDDGPVTKFPYVHQFVTDTLWGSVGNFNSFIDDKARFGSSSPSASSSPEKPTEVKTPDGDALTAQAAKNLGFRKIEDLKKIEDIKAESAGRAAEKSWTGDTPAVPSHAARAQKIEADFAAGLTKLEQRGASIEAAIKDAEATAQTERAAALKILKSQHEHAVITLRGNAFTDVKETQEVVSAHRANIAALAPQIANATDRADAATKLEQQRAALLAMETERLRVEALTKSFDAGIANGKAMEESNAEAKARRDRENAARAALLKPTTLWEAVLTSNNLVTTSGKKIEETATALEGLKALRTDLDAAIKSEEAKAADTRDAALLAQRKAMLLLLQDEITDTEANKDTVYKERQDRLEARKKEMEALQARMNGLNAEQQAEARKALTPQALDIVAQQRIIYQDMSKDAETTSKRLEAFRAAFTGRTAYTDPVPPPATPTTVEEAFVRSRSVVREGERFETAAKEATERMRALKATVEEQLKDETVKANPGLLAHRQQLLKDINTELAKTQGDGKSPMERLEIIEAGKKTLALEHAKIDAARTAAQGKEDKSTEFAVAQSALNTQARSRNVIRDQSQDIINAEAKLREALAQNKPYSAPPPSRTEAPAPHSGAANPAPGGQQSAPPARAPKADLPKAKTPEEEKIRQDMAKVMTTEKGGDIVDLVERYFTNRGNDTQRDGLNRLMENANKTYKAFEDAQKQAALNKTPLGPDFQRLMDEAKRERDTVAQAFKDAQETQRQIIKLDEERRKGVVLDQAGLERMTALSNQMKSLAHTIHFEQNGQRSGFWEDAGKANDRLKTLLERNEYVKKLAEDHESKQLGDRIYPAVGGENGLPARLLRDGGAGNALERAFNAAGASVTKFTNWWTRDVARSAKNSGENGELLYLGASAVGIFAVFAMFKNMLQGPLKSLTGIDISGGWMHALIIAGLGVFALNKTGAMGDSLAAMGDKNRQNYAQGGAQGAHLPTAAAANTNAPPTVQGNNGPIQLPTTLSAVGTPHDGGVPAPVGAQVVAFPGSRVAQTDARAAHGLKDQPLPDEATRHTAALGEAAGGVRLVAGAGGGGGPRNDSFYNNMGTAG